MPHVNFLEQELARNIGLKKDMLSETIYSQICRAESQTHPAVEFY